MDGRVARATEELNQALKAAAAAAVELQRLLPEHQGVPHYSIIEQAAHDAGCRLSGMIQHLRASDIAADAPKHVPCPSCQKRCEVGHERRTIKSIDGEIDLIESIARCPRCKRAFFPSAVSAGV